MAYRRRVFGFACATAVVTWALLTMGGVVTSRDAGMVFPDWPLSNGSVNPDGWLTDLDMGSEHGHRILGTIVGLMTMALAVMLRNDGRRYVRGLGWSAVAAVSVQGVLGGLRVTEISQELALLHACTGQAFFCLMTALAYFTSRDATAPAPAGADTSRLSVASGALVVTVFLQVVLGAQLRHVRGPVQSHVFGAALVVATVGWVVTWVLLRHRGDRGLTRPAWLLAGLVVLQIGLGLFTAESLRVAPRAWGLPTMHQSAGAVLLATSVVLTLRARHRRGTALEEVFA